jgi:hypothetical protein
MKAQAFYRHSFQALLVTLAALPAMNKFRSEPFLICCGVGLTTIRMTAITFHLAYGVTALFTAIVA